MEELFQGKSLDPILIQQIELFNSLSEQEMAVVRSQASILQLRHKARLFSIGERAEHLYVLLAGSIRIFRPRTDYEDDELARFFPGDTIGDFDFARRALYDASAEALEDSLVIMFPGFGITMDNFTQTEPHVASKIYLNAIRMITTRIKATQRIIMENMSWVQELHRLAYEDPGTGLWKQSFLSNEINQILEVPTALIMLKPDRFKILVDSRGHTVGDEAMIRIAKILKNITRKQGRGWPLRFKSNETGVLIPQCPVSQAKIIAREIQRAVASLESVPAQDNYPAFNFTATISWGMWPEDHTDWDVLLGGIYALLLDTWRAGGNRLSRYTESELP
ncbi:diguanylate cyclase [Treponema sp. TIM-1]|uniref:diguanylate cyclase domain-containing protein n=1 Tax=Treponema sp. TIM-1 TaxID=2898417 RepID=UPI00398055C3